MADIWPLRRLCFLWFRRPPSEPPSPGRESRDQVDRARERLEKRKQRERALELELESYQKRTNPPS